MRRRQHQTTQSRLDPVLEYWREFIRVQELPRGSPYRASAAEKPESYVEQNIGQE